MINFLTLTIGAFIGMMLSALLQINKLEEERERAFNRGKKAGRHEGYKQGHADAVRKERRKDV